MHVLAGGINPLSPSFWPSGLGAFGVFLVLFAAVAGAVTGAQAGFLRGRRRGTALLARFIPLVRTVINPLAGVLGVPVRTFTLWQVLGGLAWSIGITRDRRSSTGVGPPDVHPARTARARREPS